MIGILFSVVAGSLVGLQNVFNAKVNIKAGSWITTTLVLGLGFIASLILGFMFEGAQLFHLPNMELWYYFSGVIGIGVVVCIAKGVTILGPTAAVSIALSSQLIFALLWDLLGWFGLEKVPFTWNQLVGVLLVIGGIVVFKYGGAPFARLVNRSQQVEKNA